MNEKEIKVAIVTGSNRGLGLAIVKGLCKSFNGVVYLTARNAELGKKVVEGLKNEGLNVNFHQLDIKDLNSIKKFAEYLRETYGGIDILVNNAAILNTLTDDSLIGKDAEETIEINYTGTLNVFSLLSPLVRSNGRIVNISSRLGFLSEIKNKEIRLKLSNDSNKIEDISKLMQEYVEASKAGAHERLGYPKRPYEMSKIGLNAVTKLLQEQIDEDKSRTGIIVSAVCPGYLKTEMTNGGGLLTAEEGAVTPLFLALLPKDYQGPKGAFWAEDKTMNWKTGSKFTESISMFKKLIVTKFL